MTQEPALSDEEIRRLEHPEEFLEPDRDAAAAGPTATETTATETTATVPPTATSTDSGAVQKALQAVAGALDALEHAAAALRSHIEGDSADNTAADNSTKPL